MLTISLWINILVLVPIVGAMIAGRSEMDRTFGPNSTARQILLCMYLTLLLMSCFLLLRPEKKIALAVLTFQIVYKFLSVLLIRDRRTPVLWFNLAIALFHCATVWTLTENLTEGLSN